MAFASHPEWTIPTLLVHFMLNASSFFFRIPPKRISHGGRIWPEYRWHSLIFTIRSHLLILWYTYERAYNLEPNYDVTFCIVMGTMLAVDLASWSFSPEHRSPTVRGVATFPVVKFIFSVALFNTTAALLYGLRRMTIPFLPLFVIQVTAFMGTLQRKNLIGYIGLGIFSLCVANGIRVQRFEFNRVGGDHVTCTVRIIGFAAALVRLSPLPDAFRPFQSKYVIWTVAYLALRKVRPNLEEIPIEYLQGTLAVLVLGLCAACYFKLDFYKAQAALKTKIA